MNTIRRLAYLSLLSALMFIISWIESLYPIVPTMPGIRMGLSNVILLFTMTAIDISAGFMISLTKIILLSILFPSPINILLSFVGTVFSSFSMALLVRFKQSTVFTSMVGSLCHMCAQLVISTFIFGFSTVVTYAPFLVLSSLISGVFVGIVTKKILNKKNIILGGLK